MRDRTTWGDIIMGLGALFKIWDMRPVCEWCEKKCGMSCPAARVISDLEWELECASETIRELKIKVDELEEINNSSVLPAY